MRVKMKIGSFYADIIIYMKTFMKRKLYIDIQAWIYNAAKRKKTATVGPAESNGYLTANS